MSDRYTNEADAMRDRRSLERELAARRPTVADRMVQVPASLIERARDALRSGRPDRWAVYEELHALLSQPTPTAEVGDEHHSMGELYDYRMVYHAFTVRHWQHLGYPTVKSRRHSDGELCFGGGWFIIVTTLPEGQVSNHYKDEFWDLFAVPEGTPPEYDGHTPQIALERLFAHLRSTNR